MRVLGYVRVSSDEQAMSGAGLEAHRRAIITECRRRGWHLVETIEDAGYSARDLRRPGIQAAPRRCSRRGSLCAGGGEAGSALAFDARLLKLMAKATQEHWALVALDVAVDTS